MGEFILSYERYLHRDGEELNEGWKKWLSTFMLLLNLGLVPPKIQAADMQTKIEWTQSIAPEQIVIAQIAALLNRQNVDPKATDNITNILKDFNSRNKTKIDFQDLKKYMKVSSNDEGKHNWKLNISQDDTKYKVDIDNLKPMRFGSGISLVSDYGKFMSEQDEEAIHNMLYEYEKKTGVEIAILTIPSFNEEDPQDFAYKTFTRWGIGKKGQNNGILIVTSMGDRKFFIKPGYGVEGILPDAMCTRLGTDNLVPHFKEGDYAAGFRDLIESMEKSFGNEPIEQKKAAMAKQKIQHDANVKAFWIGAGQVSLLLLAIGLVGYLVVAGIKKRKKLAANIAQIKAEIADTNENVAQLLQSGDPMFNDDEILSGLSKAIEVLSAQKMRSEKGIGDVANRLQGIKNELERVQEIEREISKVKNSVSKMFGTFQEFEDAPTDMKTVAQTALQAIKNISFDRVDISDATTDKYMKQYTDLTKYFKQYGALKDEYLHIKSNIEGFETVKNKLISKLQSAREAAKKVIDMGFSTEVKTKEEDINSLVNFIKQMGDIYMTDLSQATTILGQYAHQVHAVGTEIDKPIAKYNDIMSAKAFIEKHDSDIDLIMNKIRDYNHRGYIRSSEVDQANAAVNKYEETKGAHVHTKEDPYGEEKWNDGIQMKDVLKVSAALTLLIQTLESIAQKGINRLREEEDEKRRKEEEEERRRRRREEEEEERSRSSYSSSSSSFGGSSSSSSSFGGFGGGSAGGGGGGGSW